MIGLPINIYEFTNWLKFEIKTISKDLLIDLEDQAQDGEILLKKVGFFEEDFEIFFCVLSDSLLSSKTNFFSISVYEILEIKPLTNEIITILEQKIGNFKISNAIDPILYNKIRYEKLKKISYAGLNSIKVSFSLEEIDSFQSLIHLLFESKKNYIFRTNSEKNSWIDYLIAYERSKPYPVSDIGFIFDVGAIYRERFNITDDDISNREYLKVQDRYKYELIAHLAELSKFLQSTNKENPFSAFMEFYKTSQLMEFFNQELQQKEIPDNLNNILLYAFFFKFRKLIRDTDDLTEHKFISQVERFLRGSKEEATIALLINGFMFGSLKLQNLFYTTKILPISAELFVKELEIKQKPLKEKRKKVPEKIEIENKNKSKIINIINRSGDQIFDEGIILKLDPILYTLHYSIKKSILGTFDFVKNTDKELNITKREYFISCLYLNAKKDQNLKKKNKLTFDIVNQIKEELET